ncbi:hypothetical protein A3K55_00580 [Candidatus Shapirobacteria bacterium RBG_13_44_7]|uniref:Uncharacterized protein n=1 Tax=Candidatus Shapirobacteria bacterium RBG_13_44_7 TaxID=1802149 RepID=A0A1F7SGD7_9BACT|nr:MAG: hypothetical protein A3K55_00580 [Candidatus Shapirobacteria bacterium RBG_13_44_7]
MNRPIRVGEVKGISYALPPATDPDLRQSYLRKVAIAVGGKPILVSPDLVFSARVDRHQIIQTISCHRRKVI